MPLGRVPLACLAPLVACHWGVAPLAWLLRRAIGASPLWLGCCGVPLGDGPFGLACWRATGASPLWLGLLACHWGVAPLAPGQVFQACLTPGVGVSSRFSQRGRLDGFQAGRQGNGCGWPLGSGAGVRRTVNAVGLWYTHFLSTLHATGIRYTQFCHTLHANEVRYTQFLTPRKLREASNAQVDEANLAASV